MAELTVTHTCNISATVIYKKLQLTNYSQMHYCYCITAYN